MSPPLRTRHHTLLHSMHIHCIFRLVQHGCRAGPCLDLRQQAAQDASSSRRQAVKKVGLAGGGQVAGQLLLQLLQPPGQCIDGLLTPACPSSSRVAGSRVMDRRLVVDWCWLLCTQCTVIAAETSRGWRHAIGHVAAAMLALTPQLWWAACIVFLHAH